MALADEVRAPAGGDAWTDGTAGAWLWVLVGLVPVMVAGLVTAARRRGRRGGLLVLGMAATVTMATVVGEAMHVADPPLDRPFSARSAPASTSPPS